MLFYQKTCFLDQFVSLINVGGIIQESTIGIINVTNENLSLRRYSGNLLASEDSPQTPPGDGIRT